MAARALGPLVRRVVAPNPGLMTGPGTNTYLVGVDQVAVIDPGPDDNGHLDAVAACGAGRVRWILVTHTHPDHSPGAAGLAARTGAEILGFDARDGFSPDRSIGDGFGLDGTEFRLTAVHTPGHASNHLCYLLHPGRMLFTGDHVMQGSTVVISPPDGDMTAYLASLELVRDLGVRTIAPGHGELIDDPQAVLSEYLDHRRAREAQVLAALTTLGPGPVTTADIVALVYRDVASELHPVARRSVWAHLRKLSAEGAVRGDPDDPEAGWTAVSAHPANGLGRPARSAGAPRRTRRTA